VAFHLQLGSYNGQLLIGGSASCTDSSVGTVASGDHSNRRPSPESLNAISDARIDCFEHF
jgi:hypothetical protein